MLLLDKDPLTGVMQEIEYHSLEDKTAVRTTQDISQIIERNKKLQNAEAYKKEGIKKNFQQVADIPIVVYQQWLREGVDLFNPDHWPKVKAKLQDPDNRFLRTTLGGI